MKTVVKIALGVLLAGAVMIGGCAAVIGASADHVAKEQEKNGTTVEQIALVKHGMTRSEVHRTLAPAKPHLDSSTSTQGLGRMVEETYDVQDHGELFGKSFTVTYVKGHVFDTTSIDLS